MNKKIYEDYEEATLSFYPMKKNRKNNEFNTKNRARKESENFKMLRKIKYDLSYDDQDF